MAEDELLELRNNKSLQKKIIFKGNVMSLNMKLKTHLCYVRERDHSSEKLLTSGKTIVHLKKYTNTNGISYKCQEFHIIILPESSTHQGKLAFCRWGQWQLSDWWEKSPNYLSENLGCGSLHSYGFPDRHSQPSGKIYMWQGLLYKYGDMWKEDIEFYWQILIEI